jgi:NADH-quinone oxidoreductase subunit M
LLKLGIYAIFRLLLNSFFNIYYDLIFFILSLCLLSFLYASFIALNQIDIKKIIAYSSIAHMNFSLLGLFSYNLMGLFGAFYLMFGHAITSSALFLGIGVLYDRYKTRLIFYYSSLITFMPIFSFFYFMFLLSNFGFPGTFNFVGEFFIIIGGFYLSYFITILTTVGSVLALVYSLFLYNKIFFGPLNKNFIRFYNDVTRIEFLIFFILLILILFFGIFPQTCLDFSNFFLYKLFVKI